MLYSLSGIIRLLQGHQIVVETAGVGYLVTVPAPVWEALVEGETATIILWTYVREDRFDLFGFLTADDRGFFGALMNLSGIGPKTALEVCSLPRHMLLAAIRSDDPHSLQEIKGVGRKTAEKLLVDLRQLLERHPEWEAAWTRGTDVEKHASFDLDAIAALSSLGYDKSTILQALKKLPASIVKTEDRVTAVLRSL